jgi:VIT1/CCC1 family predicted Fe2+/Mn2+ transporter
VREVFEELGLKDETLEETCRVVGASDATLLEFMKAWLPIPKHNSNCTISSASQAFEFGCSDEDMERNSLKASLVCGALFILGSLPAVVPFACTNVRNDAVIASSVCCCVMLFVVGAAKTKVTRSNPWVGGIENMFYGAAGAAGAAFPFSTFSNLL